GRASQKATFDRRFIVPLFIRNRANPNRVGWSAPPGPPRTGKSLNQRPVRLQAGRGPINLPTSFQPCNNGVRYFVKRYAPAEGCRERGRLRRERDSPGDS